MDGRAAHSRTCEAQTPQPRSDQCDALRHAGIRAGLLVLSNLLLLSTVTLIGLYALLAAVLIAAVEFAGVPLKIAVLMAVGLILLQFLLGPFLWTCNCVGCTDSAGSRRRSFRIICNGLSPKCATTGASSSPHFGIIDDGAPQAFTYGHRPNNAREVNKDHLKGAMRGSFF